MWKKQQQIINSDDRTIKLNVDEEEEQQQQETKIKTDVNDINDDDDDDNDEINEFDQLDLESQVEILTKYLRQKHLYCIWCGLAFENENDLEQQCPGDSKDLH